MLRYVIAIALLAAVIGCRSTGDEAAIRQAIDEIAESISRKDSSDIVSYLSPEFLDKDGRDRRAIRQFMVVQFLRNKDIAVLITRVEIRVSGQTAIAQLHVGLTGMSGMIPERGEYYLANLNWRKEKNKWLLHRLDWEPVLFKHDQAG